MEREERERRDGDSERREMSETRVRGDIEDEMGTVRVEERGVGERQSEKRGRDRVKGDSESRDKRRSGRRGRDRVKGKRRVRADKRKSERREKRVT